MKTKETDEKYNGNRALAPIHVAHIVWSFDTGGMENGIVNLINASNPVHLRFSVFALTHLGSSQACVSVPEVHFAALNRRPGNDWRVVWNLARRLHQVKPDVVHTHGWGTYLEGVLAARLAGIPVVIHGEHGTTFFGKRRRVLAYQALSLWTNQYITVSASLRQLLENIVGIRSDRISYIPNGVDTRHFTPRPLLRSNVRASLGIEKDEYVVGSVGRLVSVKGFDIFIDAIRRLTASGVRVRGVLVGNGPLRRELEEFSRKGSSKGIVTFLGNRKDVSDILQAFDVFVSTSHHEGMSNTILEAMATGLPVVVTAVGGTTELVQHGETGILVPPNNPAAVASALSTLRCSSETCVRIAREGMKHCLEEFPLTRMVQRYDVMYRTWVRAGGFSRQYEANGLHRL